jgi:hypothetical protein
MMTDFCLLSLFIQHFSNKRFVGALAQPALKRIDRSYLSVKTFTLFPECFALGENIHNPTPPRG